MAPPDLFSQFHNTQDAFTHPHYSPRPLHLGQPLNPASQPAEGPPPRPRVTGGSPPGRCLRLPRWERRGGRMRRL